MKFKLLSAFAALSFSASAQLYIDNATFFIDDGAVVTVQGDVFSNVDIQAAGTGKLRLGGTTAQNINMNGKVVPTLEIDNASANVVMTGALEVSKQLTFTNGKVQLGNFDLTLGTAATYTGAATGKFAETNGTGFVRKKLSAASPVTIPVGNGTTYTPVDYTISGGTYGAASFIAARSVATAHPNKHPRSTDFLKSYWKLDNNISGATISAKGNYINPASVTGNQADIVSMYYNGSNWALGTSQAATSVTAPAAANGPRDLYGMNKFVLVSPKVLLEGPFNPATGLMNEGLRSNNLIPTTDPYSSLSGFTVVGNTPVETVSPSVFAVQANAADNIVDWVFLELRTNTSPSTVIQTRSALVQRDGDIVDIDGISPIYFKNIADGSYNVFVRHRNHLGVRTNTALSLGLSSVAKNFTTASSSAYTNPATSNPPMKELTVSSAPNVWTMFGSNANADIRTTKLGPASGNDYSILLTGITTTLGYYGADFNMDGRVLKTGPAGSNDYSKLLSTLSGLNTVTQHNN